MTKVNHTMIEKTQKETADELEDAVVLSNIQHRCENHLEWVYSLNHYTILLVAPREGLKIQGNFQRQRPGQQDKQ